MKSTLRKMLLLLSIAAGSSLFVNTAHAAPKPVVARAVKLKTAVVNYKLGADSFVGFIAYDENVKGKRPGVLVVHEWWGLDDYAKRRAKELAELGYVAMAVDMYGAGKLGITPDEAIALATPLYKDPQLAKARFDAGLDELKKNPFVDTKHIGAIGYCFGGTMVINAAKLGDHLNAAVSFHGGLKGVPADKKLWNSKLLVCHGGDDKNVLKPEVDHFVEEMNAIGADYKLIVYPGARHAFTNPASTENGRKFNMPIAYNAAADAGSWKAMKAFFKKNL